MVAVYCNQRRQESLCNPIVGHNTKRLEKGWRMGETLRYVEVPGAKHTESAWAARIDQVLKFLFPK